MNELISIIIPNYNGSEFLGTCLDSVLAQTYTNLEIIVVDDASTDSSADILRAYAVRDNRLRLVLKERNEGVSIARNDALGLATGDYLMFVDGDDWIDPDTCATALDAMRTHEADVVMWSYIREMGSESRPKQIFDSDRIYDEPAVRDQLYRRMVGAAGAELARPENSDALCTVWGKLYRRELIEQDHIRFHDIRKIGTFEDGLFNLNVLRNTRKAVFLNRFFYHYRKCNDASLTTAYKPDLPGMWKQLFRLIREHLDRYHAEPAFYDALSNRVVLSLFMLGINEMESSGGTRSILHNLRQIIRDPDYRAAISDFDFHYLPIHWKVFFGFARMNCTLGVYLLLIVIQKIRGR